MLLQGLSIRRHCGLLAISRSGWYYAPRGDSTQNLLSMREIDEQHLKTPW